MRRGNWACRLTLKEYPLHGGETRKPDFLAKNPNGRVPLLELEDGRCSPNPTRSSGISPKARIFSRPIEWARAEALSWMFFEQYSHEPYVAVAGSGSLMRATED